MEEQYLREEYIEIDFRKYIRALFKWWWVIGLCAGLAAFAALFVSLVMTPEYEASAGVVALRSQVEISLGSSIQTTTDLDISLAEAAQGVAEERTQRRLASMAGLVKNGAIAQKVSSQLGDLFTEEEKQPSELLKHVKGRLLQLEEGPENSETIEIVVSYDDPAKAAAVANAWGTEYEIYVNQIYGEATVSPFTDINQQIENAKTEYDQTQEALVTFLGEEDRIAEYNRQIAEDEAIINQLRSGRQEYTAAVVNDQVAAQKRLFNNSIAAQLDSNITVFEKQRAEVLRDLNQAYSRKYRLENLLEDAYLMREQLVEGGDSSAGSNALALLGYKSRVFATSEGLPFGQLDLQVPSLSSLTPESSAVQQIADMDALISVMEDSLEEQNAIIEEESEALLAGEGYEFLENMSPETIGVEGSQSEEALEEMEDWSGLLGYSSTLSGNLSGDIDRRENEVRQLKAEVEELSKRKAQLQEQRNLAWQTYQALLSKKQEVDVAQGARGSVVRFSSPAVPPTTPESPKTMRNTALALVVGLMLGMGGAFMGEYMEVEPPDYRAVIKRVTDRKES